MANIQQLKIGDGDPDSIRFDKYYAPTANTGRYFTSLVEVDNTAYTNNSGDGVWEVNTDCDIEIVDSRTIKINKFVIDKWFIRKKLGNSTEINNWSDFKVNITGLSYLHNNVIKHTENSDEVDGFTEAYLGTGGWNVCWYPGQFTSGYYAKGFLIQGGLNYQDNEDYRAYSLHMGRAPWDIAYYSQVEDGEVSIKAYAGINSYALTMGFFGGRQTATTYGDDSNGAYEVYDVSDNPIYITLDVEDLTADIDPSTEECWDVYAGDSHVYHKDRTVENCWVKYGMAQKTTTGIDSDVEYKIISVDMADVPEEITNPMLPKVVDWENYIMSSVASDEYLLNWNCDLTNSPMQDVVKDWFANNAIPIVLNDSVNNKSNYTYEDSCVNFIYTYPFKDLKVDGDFKIIFDGFFPSLYTLKSSFALTCDKFTIQVMQDNCHWTSMNAMFYGGGFKEIEVIDANGDAMQGFFTATDFSGAFEFCYHLTEIPDNMINWYNDRSLYIGYSDGDDGSLFGYAFEGCTSLTRIGMYGNTRESEYNTVRAFNLAQTFNACTSLTYIGPVLDLSFVNFYMDGTIARPYWAFNQCTKLEDVRIKNLNGSYVDFTANGTTAHGNLLSLNQESVEYLFENLTDLTTYSQYEHGDDTPMYVYGRPYAESGEIHCPSEWGSYVTTDMITAANAKGWTIYIGDSKVSLNK